MVDRVNSMEGSGSKVSQDHGIRENVTSSTTVVGTCKPLSFGKEVVYCKIGATAISGAGTVIVGPAQVANHSNVTVRTASIGAKVVIPTLGATKMAKDLYKDGYLLVNDAVGEAYSYMVAGHASAAASSTAAQILLKDGLEVALTTASEVTLIQNPYSGVLYAFESGTKTSMPVGVALCTAAASSYAWIGKTGLWPVPAEGTVVAGEDAYLGSGGATVLFTAATTFHRLGKFCTTAAATENVLVDFQL